MSRYDFDDDDLTPHQRQLLENREALDGDVPVRRRTGHIRPVDSQDDLEVAVRVMNGLHNADQLEQKAGLRVAKAQALHDQAHFIRTNPPTFGQTGILGNQKEVLPGQEVEVANWVGPDADTGPIDVLFGPVDQFPPSAPGGTNYRPYGVVIFGTTGMSLRAEVDIGRGVQFTIPAASAQLLVALESSIIIPGVTVPLKLSGMLSRNVITHQQPVTRTVYVDDLIVGATVDITIPAFARSFSILKANAGSNITASVLNYTGTGLFAVNRPAAAFETFMDPIPLPGNAAYMQVSNGGGVGTFLTIVFNLAF